MKIINYRTKYAKDSIFKYCLYDMEESILGYCDIYSLLNITMTSVKNKKNIKIKKIIDEYEFINMDADNMFKKIIYYLRLIEINNGFYSISKSFFYTYNRQGEDGELCSYSLFDDNLFTNRKQIISMTICKKYYIRKNEEYRFIEYDELTPFLLRLLLLVLPNLESISLYYCKNTYNNFHKILPEKNNVKNIVLIECGFDKKPLFIIKNYLNILNEIYLPIRFIALSNVEYSDRNSDNYHSFNIENNEFIDIQELIQLI